MKKNYYTLEKKNFFQSRGIPNFPSLSSLRGAEMKVRCARELEFLDCIACDLITLIWKKGSTAVWRTQKSNHSAEAETNSKIIREPTKIKTSIMKFSLMKEKWMKEKREEFFVGWMKHLRVGSIQLYRLVFILQASKSINYLARD